MFWNLRDTKEYSEKMKRRAAILARLGIMIPENAHILDFGCGEGRTVYSLLDQGYTNVIGYDISERLALRKHEDRSHFFIADAKEGNRLPFSDNVFDLIISEQVIEHVMDQVGVFREMYRTMRPGGCAIHVFPARYTLLEPHIYVPFGGIFAHRWWYNIWALLGIRNEYQQGLSANEIADRNACYFVEGLNYVSNSCYEVVWRQLGYKYKWIDQENFETSERAFVRVIGYLNRALPLVGWMNRTFHTRRVLLWKPQ